MKLNISDFKNLRTKLRKLKFLKLIDILTKSKRFKLTKVSTGYSTTSVSLFFFDSY